MKLNVQIDSGVLKRVPSFKVGAVLYKGIQIADSPQMLKGRLRLFQEALFFDYADRSLEDEPVNQEWRDTLANLNPSFTGRQTSHTRMLTDIQQNRYLEPADSATDLSRFFSLKYAMPVHIHDARNLKGPIHIALGDSKTLITVSAGDETFGSLSQYIHHHPVSADTKDALQLVFFRPSVSKNEAHRLLEALTKMFEQIHGGEHVSAVSP
ncbi:MULTISPECIES: hypothetical protein [unclassified Bacillus (in: firmicutes)]|uniref:hypothetical protein n=1 Tax=unclassified Bacillus (in: firmicutes) TaxID=185979 RepID=UPI000414E7A4|nr:MULTISPECIES: hypothetical protein [unclassified Bacillus (in: firmicutes)]QHZ45979.1 hypothetical protein M654_006595 [Bacillus sp. NSP9.1]WFA06165.1 hypothetical protein P3X63_05065 [Bacillus sp. HSf4]